MQEYKCESNEVIIGARLIGERLFGDGSLSAQQRVARLYKSDPDFPVKKIGRCYFARPLALDAWLAYRTQKEAA